MNTQSKTNNSLILKSNQVKALLEKLQIEESLFEEMICRENRLLEIIQDCLVAKELNGFLEAEQRTKWQESRLGDRVEELYLNKQAKFSRVEYWQCLVKEKAEAMDIYYQVCNNEVTFLDLKNQNKKARLYSNQLYSGLDINLQKVFKSGKPGQIYKPLKGKYGYLIFQIVSFSRLQLTSSLRQELLKELELNWALNQVRLAIEEI
jgi:hypothetical protein